GPVSEQDLTNLAAAGELLRTDTVWKEDVETGFPAGEVQGLFAAAGGSPAPAAEPTAAQELPPDAELVPLDAPAASAPPAPKARATAQKGAVIVGQDGVNVKYRMKCTTCGHEDSSWKTMRIARGTMRSSFFCPKCRKRRDVEIH